MDCGHLPTCHFSSFTVCTSCPCPSPLAYWLSTWMFSSSLCRSLPEWLKLHSMSPCVNISVFSQKHPKTLNILLHGQEQIPSVHICYCCCVQAVLSSHFMLPAQTSFSLFATLIRTCSAVFHWKEWTIPHRRTRLS